MTDLLKKSLDLLLRRQTNILSAAYIIMATSIVSLLLGLVRTRLLFSIFGPSNTLGIYNYAYVLPDSIFQLTIGAALTSAFIPVFSEYLAHGKEHEGHKIASTLLSIGLVIFGIFSIILAIFAPFVLDFLFNRAQNFTTGEIMLMANLMRFIIIGQLLFIIGTFFTALLQSYNHFFIPGIAAATYNLGIIIGILLFHERYGLYSIPLGVITGAILYVLLQIPLAKKVGFSFTPTFNLMKSEGIKKIARLMWPRTLQRGVEQFGSISLFAIIAFMVDPGRMFLLFDSARILMFAPVSLFGYSIAQAAFPVLSREKNKLDEFRATFLSSFQQMLYLVLPISAIILVLRIPIVRLAFGADKFDWPATVLTGQTLAFLSISIFAQALIFLFYRAFYALQNSLTPLIVSAISTVFLIVLSYIFVVMNGFGIQSVAIAFTIANIIQLFILFFLLDKKTGGFQKWPIILVLFKFTAATLLTGLALYIPIKLLDQLVFDTTKTINLIILTGISGIIGLTLYLFLTWLLNIREAYTYLYMIRKLGNWRDILGRSTEVIAPPRQNP